MRPVTLNPNNVSASLQEIERASHDADVVELAQNFTIGNSPSAQRVFVGSNVQLSAAGVGNGNDATEDTLFTFTLPANSLTAVGEGITVLATGTFANNSNTKTVNIYFGSVLVGASGPVTIANGGWMFRLDVFKSGTKAQIIAHQTYLSTVSFNARVQIGSEDDTAGIVIKVTGQSGSSSANDVVANVLAVNGAVSDIGNAFATWLSDCQRGGLNRTT